MIVLVCGSSFSVENKEGKVPGVNILICYVRAGCG